jgi:hypothetical protein
MTGGSGTDTFIIRTGDGSTTLADANVITDFNSNGEYIGLDNNLNFSQLTIEQGTGAYENDVLISVTNTGEYLLILKSVNVADITDLDFTAVDINESPAAAVKKDDFGSPARDDDQAQPGPGIVKKDDFGGKTRDDGPTQSDLSNSGFIVSDVLVEEVDLGPITFPETVVTSDENITPDLSDLIELPGDHDQSQILDFDIIVGDTPMLASNEMKKPVAFDLKPQADLFIDSDYWNPDNEEMFYTSEVI